MPIRLPPSPKASSPSGGPSGFRWRGRGVVDPLFPLRLYLLSHAVVSCVLWLVHGLVLCVVRTLSTYSRHVASLCHTPRGRSRRPASRLTRAHRLPCRDSDTLRALGHRAVLQPTHRAPQATRQAMPHSRPRPPSPPQVQAARGAKRGALGGRSVADLRSASLHLHSHAALLQALQSAGRLDVAAHRGA